VPNTIDHLYKKTNKLQLLTMLLQVTLSRAGSLCNP